jgi:hypothetical protein
VISGHDFDAISIQTASTGNRVVGNLLGTDPAGTSAIPNAVTGVGISNSANNEVGGVSPGERNVISGNDTAGIRISGSTASGNRVIGNLIGVKANGVDALPNGTKPSSLIGGADSAGGILFDNGAHDNVIGGLLWETGKRNIIAGNALAGVRFKGASAHNFVLGNSIGVTDAEGNAPVANQGPGILLLGASARNVIGGLDPFDGTFASGANDIGHNTGAGVAMAADSSHTNTVSDNAIHDNGGLGLDLGNDGRPAGPADGFYNAPFLTTAYRYAGFTLLSGTFDPGTDAAQLEIYTSPSADPSGYGEGRRHLITIATNAAGAFAYALPALDPGTVLTMLAIRRQASGLTDPSEFSNAVTVQDPPAAIDHAPIVTMIQPNGGETLDAGSIYEIQWTVDFIGGLNPQRIEFSTDSGATWEDLAIELDPAVRSWQWTVPRLRTETARVRVTVSDWAGRSGSAISAADFMIHTLLPWTLGDAAEALRIAAGLQAALLTDVSRLDLEIDSGSLGRIDVRDAVRIARKAAGLDP